MVFIQLHRRSCYLKVYLFWLNYVRASVTYDTKLHEDCLSNVYTLSSSAHIWWNSRDARLTKKASMTRNFWNVKEGFKWSRGASFQVVKFQKKITSTLTPPPPPPLIQTLWVCCTAGFTSNGRGDEKPRPCFTSRLFKDLLPEVRLFLLRNIYRFLSAGDCHHGNRLVSVVFKLCKGHDTFLWNHTRQNPRILQCILTSAWKCLRGCLSYFHPVNFASKIILPETLSTERLYLGKN